MPLRTQVEEMPNLNLTSMIDVVFLLIIFFMLGTRFAEAERKITLQVPQVADNRALPAAPDRHAVNVYQDGEITLDGRTVTLVELTAQLTADRQRDPDLAVNVRGDATTNLQHFAEVLNACKQAGVLEISMGVKTAPRRR